MTYQVLARRLRPQRFEDVVGQDHVTRTLRAAIAAGRVAHAFLFTGPRGVGKTTTARLLAKALNCEKGPTAEPCNACSNCKEIAEGIAFDVLEDLRKTFLEQYYLLHTALGKLYLLEGEFDKSDFYLNKALSLTSFQAEKDFVRKMLLKN